MASSPTPLEKAKTALRSLLLSSPRGLSAEQIAKDWEMIMFTQCPYRELGFKSVVEFVESLPDVAAATREGSYIVYTAVPDKSTAHIKELVDNQRKGKNHRLANRRQPRGPPPRQAARMPPMASSAKGSAPKRRHGASSVRVHPPPTSYAQRASLPSSSAANYSTASSSLSSKLSDVKSNLRTLLTNYPKGVHINMIAEAYRRHFKASIPVTGNEKLEAYLRSLPDIVNLQQRPQGLMCYLKAPGKAAGSSSNRINGGTLATNSRQPVDNRPAAVGSSHAARISATSAAASNAWMTVDKKGRLRVADSPPPSSSSSPSPTPENGFGRWSSPLAAVSKTKTQAAPTSETAALLEWDDLEAALYSDEQKEQSCGSDKEQVASARIAHLAGNSSQVPLGLRQQIHKILMSRPQGVYCNRLPHEYKNLHGEDLQPAKYGFVSVVELADNMKDVCQITRPNQHGDWVLLPTVEGPPGVDAGAEEENRLPKVQSNIQQLLVGNVGGLPVADLAKEYKISYGEVLDPVSLGLENLDMLLKTMSDTVKIVDFRLTDYVRLRCERRPTPSTAAASLSTASVTTTASSTTAVSSSYSSDVRSRLQARRSSSSDASFVFKQIELAVKEECDVFVGHIVSPSLFFIQLCSTVDELEELNQSMSDFYSSPLRKTFGMTRQEVAVGMPCCGLYAGVWYRGKVESVIDNDYVQVYYVDYGNTEVVALSDICRLRMDYRSLPAQAIKCSLSFLLPADGAWSDEAFSMFRELAPVDRSLYMTIASKELDVLSVVLIDTSSSDDGEDINLINRLAEEGLATFDYEGFQSSGLQSGSGSSADSAADMETGNEADTKVVENGFAEEVDEDDLEKLICEEVEDVSAESDSLNVREDTASSSGTEQDEDLQSLNNMIDTLNVRRGHLLSSLQQNFNAEIVGELQVLESVIKMSLARRNMKKAKPKDAETKQRGPPPGLLGGKAVSAVPSAVQSNVVGRDGVAVAAQPSSSVPVGSVRTTGSSAADESSSLDSQASNTDGQSISAGSTAIHLPVSSSLSNWLVEDTQGIGRTALPAAKEDGVAVSSATGQANAVQSEVTSSAESKPKLDSSGDSAEASYNFELPAHLRPRRASGLGRGRVIGRGSRGFLSPDGASASSTVGGLQAVTSTSSPTSSVSATVSTFATLNAVASAVSTASTSSVATAEEGVRSSVAITPPSKAIAEDVALPSRTEVDVSTSQLNTAALPFQSKSQKVTSMPSGDVPASMVVTAPEVSAWSTESCQSESTNVSAKQSEASEDEQPVEVSLPASLPPADPLPYNYNHSAHMASVRASLATSQDIVPVVQEHTLIGPVHRSRVVGPGRPLIAGAPPPGISRPPQQMSPMAYGGTIVEQTIQHQYAFPSSHYASAGSPHLPQQHRPPLLQRFDGAGVYPGQPPLPAGPYYGQVTEKTRVFVSPYRPPPPQQHVASYTVPQSFSPGTPVGSRSFAAPGPPPPGLPPPNMNR